jgi:hypothetical protein
MDTYTIAAAARLVGAPKGKLYEAIRTGRLQPIPAQASTSALTVYNALHAHPYRWTNTGEPLVRDTPFSRTRCQQRQRWACFSLRPKRFERLFYSLRFCLDLAVEMRQRVMEQLQAIAPKEFQKGQTRLRVGRSVRSKYAFAVSWGGPLFRNSRSLLVSAHHWLSLCLRRRTLSSSVGLSVAPSLRSGRCTCKNPCRSYLSLCCPLTPMSH